MELDNLHADYYVLLEENVTLEEKNRQLTEELKLLKEKYIPKDSKHFEWMSYPDYPEPPECDYSEQTWWEERDRWVGSLKEFWTKHSITLNDADLKQFGL